MVERERWEGRIRAVEKGVRPQLPPPLPGGGNTKLVRDRYEALHAAIAGDGERGEGE